MVPVVGRLADMLGRKNLYNLGFVIFTVGSLLCALAQPQYHGLDLVVYRMIQGVGGALLITNSAAIVTDAFRRGNVGFGLGVNGIAFSAGFLLGPVVGGVLTSISWRLVFLINVPIGIVGTIWGVLQLREPVTLPKGQRFDWAGSVTFTLGLGALLLGVSLYAFPVTAMWVVYVLFVVAAVSLALFVVAERRAPQPMLNLHLFENRSFAYASAANGLNGLARGAVLFVLIFFLQGPYGYDPLTAGILLAPFGARLPGRRTDFRAPLRSVRRALPCNGRVARLRRRVDRASHGCQHDAVFGPRRVHGAHGRWFGPFCFTEHERDHECG